MVLHNPNNWHWVNKDVAAWAREHVEKQLKAISVEADGASAKVDQVLTFDGDVDVSQRKGKVITLFDVKLVLEYNGASSETSRARHGASRLTGGLPPQELRPMEWTYVAPSRCQRWRTTRPKMSMSYVPLHLGYDWSCVAGSRYSNGDDSSRLMPTRTSRPNSQ